MMKVIENSQIPNLPTISQNEPLDKWTTFGIGGPARYFSQVSSIVELLAIFQWSLLNDVKPFILGKGSNVIFDDRGYNGIVIINKINTLEDLGDGKFCAGAGYSFSLLGIHTARKGWSGLEFASGIPAAVGGAIFMNAGANGSCVSDFLQSVDFVDENGHLHTFHKNDLSFGYRHSSFQNMPGAIISATFQLIPDEKARNRQLDIINYRKSTQPLQDKSAGCIFRNPPDLAAGALIDRSGLKGAHQGGASISSKHANFIINNGCANCADVKKLIEIIQETVKKEYNVDLEREVRIVDYLGRLCQ